MKKALTFFVTTLLLLSFSTIFPQKSFALGEDLDLEEIYNSIGKSKEISLIHLLTFSPFEIESDDESDDSTSINSFSDFLKPKSSKKKSFTAIPNSLSKINVKIYDITKKVFPVKKFDCKTLKARYFPLNTSLLFAFYKESNPDPIALSTITLDRSKYIDKLRYNGPTQYFADLSKYSFFFDVFPLLKKTYRI